MTIKKLPKKTRKLLENYLKIRAGKLKLVCPYYQNVWKTTKKPVYSGKGLPKEIEKEIEKLVDQKPILRTVDKETFRHYLVMAGIGIDCSGLVFNLLNQYLIDKFGQQLKESVNLKGKPVYRQIIFRLRPRTNLSAHELTSFPVSQKIDWQDSQPGDLLKVGRPHVALITKVWLKNKKISKIQYAHSTSQYKIEHGVRIGEITIKNSRLPLGKQDWNENYQGKNWTKEDFQKTSASLKGIFRIQISR